MTEPPETPKTHEHSSPNLIRRPTPKELSNDQPLEQPAGKQRQSATVAGDGPQCHNCWPNGVALNESIDVAVKKAVLSVGDTLIKILQSRINKKNWKENVYQLVILKESKSLCCNVVFPNFCCLNWANMKMLPVKCADTSALLVWIDSYRLK